MEVYTAYNIQLAFFKGDATEPYSTWYSANSESVSAWSAPVQVVLVEVGEPSLTSASNEGLITLTLTGGANDNPIVAA